MVKVYRSLDNEGTFIHRGIKITILYFDYDKIFLFISGRFYKSHFRGCDTNCKIHCSIFDECAGYENSLCRKIYYLMNKETGSRLYFAEIKITLFLSRIFISKLR